MKCCKKETGHLFFVATLLIALCFAITMVADAQKPAPPAKGAPAAPEKAGTPSMEKTNQPATQEKGGAEAEKGMEYAACSPQFPGEQIAEMMEFASSLSSELPGKLRAIVMQCDFNTNSRILGILENLQGQVAESQFETEDQEKRFLAEKAKEVEIELLLTQKPIKEAELKKLLSDIFEIRQKNMTDEAAALEKEAADLKKRVDERQNLKDQIVERKSKEISGETSKKAAEGGTPERDKLSWD
jgi:hypothetical protein